MKDLQHYLDIQFGSGAIKIIPRDEYNVCWRTAVENMLYDIIKKLEEIK